MPIVVSCASLLLSSLPHASQRRLPFVPSLAFWSFLFFFPLKRSSAIIGNEEGLFKLDFPKIDLTIGEEEFEDTMYKKQKLSSRRAPPQEKARDLSVEPSNNLKRPAPEMPPKTKKSRKSSAKPTTSKVPSLPVSIPLSSVSSAIPKIKKPRGLSEKTSKRPTLPPAIPKTGFKSSTPIKQKLRDIMLKPPTNETKMSDLSMISPLASVYDAKIPSDVNKRTGPNSTKQHKGPNLNDSSNRNNHPNGNRNDPKINGYNSRGRENSLYGGQNNIGRERNFLSNSSSYNNISLMTSHQFYYQKNVYRNESDNVFTVSQAPKALIMKEDLSPYEENELKSLRVLIEDAILRDKFDGWAPILDEGAVYFNVACEILCLTAFTASWFLSCDLGKIGDKQLRIIRSCDMPHVNFNAAYLGVHRSPRDFLNILSKQNPDTGLNVQSWFVTDLNEQSGGMVYVAIRMSLKSAEYLVDIKKRELYFGARTITFHECYETP